MSSKRRVKYRIKLTPRFNKGLMKLPKSARARIAEKIEELKANPHSFKKLHGELEGLYSMRIGDYRAIYAIDENRETILLLSVAHRKKIYRSP
jgi:mRNA interferase RelE/StbE